MLLFGVCFVLYFIKLSAGKGFQNVRERRFWERFASTSRNSHMFWNARMKVANGIKYRELTDASTLPSMMFLCQYIHPLLYKLTRLTDVLYVDKVAICWNCSNNDSLWRFVLVFSNFKSLNRHVGEMNSSISGLLGVSCFTPLSSTLYPRWLCSFTISPSIGKTG